MLLIVIKTAVVSFFCFKMIKLVHYLALTTSEFLKKLRTYHHQLRLDNNKIEETEELGCWQDPPDDVKEMIVKRMSFSDRVRFSSLCKSWRLVSMRRDILTCSQLPWLLHPQDRSRRSLSLFSNPQDRIRCRNLSFSSLSESKVFKWTLPCPHTNSRLKHLAGRSNQTSYFLESSRGWLVMLEWEIHYGIAIKKEPVVDLLNPVSGAQHRLPPLQAIPGYKVKSVDARPTQVVLSSTDVSKAMVAAVLGFRRLILVCRPGDKSWSVFQVFDENDSRGCIMHTLFSNTGILYALVRGSSNGGREAWIESRSLRFGDDEKVRLKVIYEKDEWWNHEGLLMHEALGCRLFLSEPTDNELLLVYQIQGTNVNIDFMEANPVAEEGNNNNNNGEGDENNIEGNQQNESVLEWVGQILRKALILMHLKSSTNDEKPDILNLRTKCFIVYKIDPENKFRRVQDLGDQILFLAEDNSSLSLLASDFQEVRGNCIYFAMREKKYGIIHTSHEIGIFYLDNGRIERPFPTFEMTEDSRLSWFMPSL